MQAEYRLAQFELPLPEPFSYERAVARYGTPAPQSHHEESWPVLYVLTNERAKTAYIGQTTSYRRRMREHTKNAEKDFDRSLLIDSPVFNQSTTFDYENRLIELFLADERYRVTNKNNGYAQFDYYDRGEYRQQFRSLWNKLQDEGFAIHRIEELENSDLFKFSPFKTLTPDQYEAIGQMLSGVVDGKRGVTVVNGMPGTGKTILAISFLFKLKSELAAEEKYRDLRVGFVAPMESLRKTLKEVAKSLPGLKAGDILSPSDVVKKEPYDILLVDEAHRLGNSLSAGMNTAAFYSTCESLDLPKTSNQLDWVLKCCNKAFLFFDPRQKVRASGLSEADFKTRLSRLAEDGAVIDELYLSTQMRVRGGDEYLDLVYGLLTNDAAAHANMNFDKLFSSKPYDVSKGDPGSDAPRYQFAIMRSFAEFCELQQQKEAESGLSRMMAGFAWKWISNKDASAYDITIEGIDKRWNTVSKDWVNSPGAVNEVGCIHTVQGYDLNYGFVIIGPDLRFDHEAGRVTVSKADFKDNGAKRGSDEAGLMQIIVNAYYVLMTRGMLGTFLYVCDPDLRDYLAQFIPVI